MEIILLAVLTSLVAILLILNLFLLKKKSGGWSATVPPARRHEAGQDDDDLEGRHGRHRVGHTASLRRRPFHGLADVFNRLVGLGGQQHQGTVGRPSVGVGLRDGILPDVPLVVGVDIAHRGHQSGWPHSRQYRLVVRVQSHSCGHRCGPGIVTGLYDACIDTS